MKYLITSAPCLDLIDLTYQDIALTVGTDAINIAIGGSILVEKGGSYNHVAYYSRKFNDTKQRYSTTDHKMLAIFDNLCHFKHMLLGLIFKLFTDHKSLTTYFTKNRYLLQEKLYGNWNYISFSQVCSCNMQQEKKSISRCLQLSP